MQAAAQARLERVGAAGGARGIFALTSVLAGSNPFFRRSVSDHSMAALDPNPVAVTSRVVVMM
jgi:hypothetical protein